MANDSATEPGRVGDLSQTSIDSTVSTPSTAVFAEWCLTRSALRLSRFLPLLLPVFLAACLTALELSTPWYPRQGHDLMAMLLSIAAGFMFFGGVRYASSAVCWETSNELRDLVRLTGLAPKSLFWCQFLVRWWTVFLSILLLLPLISLARTLGQTTVQQLTAGVCVILMIFVLTAGFAAMAAVSTAEAGNAELTASTSTVILMILYHLLFGMPAFILLIVSISFRGALGNGPLSSVQFLGEMFSQSMPIAVLYRAIASPELFNPLVPGFWMHLLTGLFCMSLAVKVIENRFRVTTQGDQPVGTNLAERQSSRGCKLVSIRCSDRPIFWKDTRLADRTGAWRSLWNVAGFLLTGAVIALSFTMGPVLKTMLGGAAFCIFICMVVFRFDGLVTAEFRDRTWTSLMILPIGYRTILREKLAAAFRARSSMLFPAGVATVIAGSTSPLTMFMMAMILSLAGVLLAEVSVLNQLTPKSGIGALTGVFLLIMVPVDVLLWQLFPTVVSFGITIVALLSLIVALYYVVDRNFERWSDA